MSRSPKLDSVFVQLVNKQLLPHGKTYEDVKKDPQFYLRYKTTTEAEKEFMTWGVQLLREELKLSKKMAEQEMSWFVLQWGLTTNQDLRIEDVETEQQPEQA